LLRSALMNWKKSLGKMLKDSKKLFFPQENILFVKPSARNILLIYRRSFASKQSMNGCHHLIMNWQMHQRWQSYIGFIKRETKQIKILAILVISSFGFRLKRNDLFAPLSRGFAFVSTKAVLVREIDKA